MLQPPGAVLHLVELQKRSYTVLHALSVDYLGIYEVNFDTGECKVYRSSERLGMDWAACFQEGYAAGIVHAVKADDPFAVIQGNHHQGVNPLPLQVLVLNRSVWRTGIWSM